MKKIRVGVIFGGKSAEHEVSIMSARSVLKALDKKKYEPILIGIDKKGLWYGRENSSLFLKSDMADLSDLKIIQHSRINGEVVNLVDVVFPVLHGPYGENGSMQGLLKLLNVPFVGSSVLGSAVAMDKDVAKRLIREAGIPTQKFLAFKKNDSKINFSKIIKELGLPFFVKPANLGSSIGISKVKSKKEFLPAVKNAFRYDNKILIEEYINGREIECSVLGNENPIASVPGEIITNSNHEFYSYEAKYLDENGAKLIIPAKLPKNIIREIRHLAVKTFKTFCCEGMARVDFFLDSNGKIFVNEVNTIPGFTNISMYPKLLEASGIPYFKLLDTLIQLAIERFKKEQLLKLSPKV